MSRKFLKVKCGKCKNEQVIFSSPSTMLSITECSKSVLELVGQ